MREKYKYMYVDEKTREKIEVPASALILECECGETFRLYGDKNSSVFVRCDEQLVVHPKTSNKIELFER